MELCQLNPFNQEFAMNRRVIGCAVVALFVMASLCHAQESYTIKLKESQKGDSFKVKTGENKKQVTKVADGQGNVLNDMAQTEGKSFVYTTTVIDRPAGKSKPTSFRRTYEKAVITKDGEKRTSSLEGKTVVFDRKDGKLQVRLEDGSELTPEMLADLGDEAKDSSSDVSDEDFLPKNAVKLNETWTVDSKAIAKKDAEANKIFDMSKAKINGKLVRVYKKGNSQFGVMEFDFHLPVNADLVQEGVKFKSGKLSMKLTMDVCIDGSLMEGTKKGTMDMDIHGGGEQMGIQFSVVSTLNGTMDEAREEVKKK